MSPTRQGPDVAGANPDADAAPVVRQPNWTVCIVIGMLAVGAVVVAFVAYYGYSSSHKKMEECDRLTRLVDQQVRIAADKAEEYDFVGAKDVLLAATIEVEESPYANVYRIDELNGKLAAARYDLARRETDHLDKTRAGWKLIDGRFVSPAEQQRALAERNRQEEKKAKRKAEERKLTLAEKRRWEEEKARRQEKERESETRSGRKLYVQANDVRVREAPNLSAAVLLTVNNGHEVIEITRQGSWVEVGVARTGKIGWVPASWLGTDQHGGATATTATPQFKRFKAAFEELNSWIRSATGVTFLALHRKAHHGAGFRHSDGRGNAPQLW